MAKTWILDTDTKGTGAQMVPLEETKERPQRRTAPDVVAPERPRKETAAPGPSRPRRFKVVDVMTRQALAEDAGVRATVDVLRDVRSVVDVTIHVWDEDNERWRQLTRRESDRAVRTVPLT
jgi:hypothetical protein